MMFVNFQGMEDIVAVAPKTPLAQKRLCGGDSRVWLLMDAVQNCLNFVQGSQLWKNEHLHVLKVSLLLRFDGGSSSGTTI